MADEDDGRHALPDYGRREAPRLGASRHPGETRVACPRITIGDATAEERLWAGRLMAASEPWITLGRGEDACRAAALIPPT